MKASDAKDLVLKSSSTADFYLDFVEKTLEQLYSNIKFHASLGQNQTTVYVAFLIDIELKEVENKLKEDGFKTKILGDNEVILIEWESPFIKCCM